MEGAGADSRRGATERGCCGGHVDDDEVERRRHSRNEEIEEIKSLRRIISAYLNYSDAAERDVRRYERSFRKLPPAHKALLSHFPSKFQRLKWCIQANSCFIMNMLQAFESPLDMSQDIDMDLDEDEKAHNGIGEHSHFEASRIYGENNHVAMHNSFSKGSHVSSDAQAVNQFEMTCVDKELLNGSSPEYIRVVRPRTTNGSEQHTGIVKEADDEVKDNSNRGQDTAETSFDGNVKNPKNVWLDPSVQLNVPLVDVDKVRCIIRNIVRDWAPEGQKERDQCYKPILEELDRLFPERRKGRLPSCLVPGAGLGRLALEISCLGFMCQGNEFSYYMMICSSFILNHSEAVGEWTIYPWIHSNCNSFSDSDQLRAVSFPDVLPASAGISEGFSMCGGDFVEVYGDPSQKASWDAVVTCFFLDTAHNIVEYIEIISKLIKDGGVWINFGPLLYHFADAYGAENDMSIELSLEDVKKVVLHFGFDIEVEKVIETTYTTNPKSMMQNRYFAAFWTMRKRART